MELCVCVCVCVDRGAEAVIVIYMPALVPGSGLCRKMVALTCR